MVNSSYISSGRPGEARKGVYQRIFLKVDDLFEVIKEFWN